MLDARSTEKARGAEQSVVEGAARLAADHPPFAGLPARLETLLRPMLDAERLDLYALLDTGGLLVGEWSFEAGSTTRVLTKRPETIVSQALASVEPVVVPHGQSPTADLTAAVGLPFGGETVGVLVVRGRAVCDEVADLAAALQTCAPIVAACVVAARSNLSEATMELSEALNEIRSAMAVSLDSAAACSVFAQVAHRLIAYDHAGIALVASRRAMVERFFEASVDDDDELVVEAPAGEPQPLSQSAIGIVRATDAPLMVADIAVDPRFCGSTDRALISRGLRSFLAVPLRLEGRFIGVLFFADRRAGAYDEEELVRAQVIAAQVSAPVHNLRVYGLARAQGAIDERNRLSRAFAEATQPNLARALALLDSGSAALSEQTLDDCRAHVLQARSSMHTVLAGGANLLATRLDEQLESASRAWGLDTGFSVSGVPTPLSLESESALLDAMRIVVSGSARYRRSWRMDVELEFREPHVRLTMLDEGHSSVAQSGIDAAIAAAAATVERAGGSVTVIRASILRTKVEITLPLIETAAVKAVAASESAIVRHGLQEVLRTAGGIELVAIADGPNRLVETCRALSPDVAILALGSVSADSVAQMSWIRDASPGTELLVLAPRVETWDVEACLNAGARGCMPDDLEPGELAAAVRGVADGDYQVPRPVSDTMLSRYAHLMADRGGHEALSQREIEVLALMVRGCKNREIADQLFISQHTVKSHVARVFQKLGVPDRASAVRVALLRRLVVDAPD